MSRLVPVNEDGRRIGEGHPNATIPEETVSLIRELHEESGWGYRRIAKHLGLAWFTVCKIAKYQRRASTPKHWKRIEAPPGPTEA